MAPLPFTSDGGPGIRATMGVVVLQTDETLEVEFRDFLPSDGIALYHTRIPFEPTVTPETLARMEGDLGDAVRMMPGSAVFDVIGYGCTSASAVIGEDRVAAQVRSVCPGAKVTNPLSAVTAALKAVGAKRIATITPYIPEVSSKLRDRLAAQGIETAALASFEQIEDAAVARITPSSILDAVVATAQEQDVDAVFVSCTSLRAAPVIPEAEQRLGIPVVSSNQALAWHMMRLAGLRDAPVSLGMLAKF